MTGLGCIALGWMALGATGGVVSVLDDAGRDLIFLGTLTLISRSSSVLSCALRFCDEDMIGGLDSFDSNVAFELLLAEVPLGVDNDADEDSEFDPCLAAVKSCLN